MKNTKKLNDYTVFYKNTVEEVVWVHLTINAPNPDRELEYFTRNHDVVYIIRGHAEFVEEN